MNKTRFVLWLIVAVILLSSCYSTRNATKIRKGIKGAYIAPKSFNDSPINSSRLISSGAYYADGTVRIGLHNIYRDMSGQLKVKYLAEEQPDMGLEILRSMSGSGKWDSGLKGGNAKAAAKFIDSVKTTLTDITHKSNSLNLARSILYRFNENVYNGASDQDMDRFVSSIVPSLKEVQKQEFINAAKESSDNLKIKRMEFLLNLDKVTQSLKDNKLNENEINAIIKGVIVSD